MALTPDDPISPDSDPGVGDTSPSPETPSASGPASTPLFGPPSPTPPPVFQSAPFGSKPPRKSRRGLFILLFVLGGFLFLVFVLVVGIIATVSNVFRGPAMPIGGSLIGLVRIDGVIMDPSKVLEAIHKYRDERRVRAVLVRVDSPGGAVGASQEIYEAINALRKSGKKVVVSMGNVAASGGYYVSCAADEVFANPGTLTGSIGVIFSVPNVEAIAEKVGVRQQVVKSGKFKDIGSMTRTMTPEEQKLLQGVIDDTYNQFVEAIMRHRTPQITEALVKTEAESKEMAAELGGDATAEKFLRHIADGRIFTGRQALEYGLVDTLGTEQDATNRLCALAGIAKPEMYEYRSQPKTLRDLFESGAKSALSSAGLPLGGPRLEYRLPF
jgi:protease IV